MTGDGATRFLTIAAIYGKIPPRLRCYLRDAAKLRIERRQKRGRLRHVNGKLGSASQRQRLTPDGVAQYEAERASLNQRLADLTVEHREIVRSDAYHAAVVAFYRAATQKYDTRECIFGSQAA